MSAGVDARKPMPPDSLAPAPVSGSRLAAWALLCAAWHVLSLLVTLPLLSAPMPREAQFLAQPALWGVVSMVGILVLERAILGTRPAVPLGAAALALVGLALASALELALFRWSMGRFGAFDSDYIGATAGLFALVVTSAVAAFATLSAPRGAGVPPAGAAVLAALGSGLVFALNTGGLGNGLGADSVALAVLVALAGGYALLAGFVSAVVVIRRELLPDEGAA